MNRVSVTCIGLVASVAIFTALLVETGVFAPNTMQPDCRDANVPYTMQRDPAHEAPHEYPEPPR